MNNFNDYIAEIRASERLKKTLELFKKGNLTIEEAIEFIASDVQFHKKEIQESSFSGYSYIPTWIGGTGSGITYTSDPLTGNPYLVSGTTTTTSVSLSGPDNSTT